MKILLFCALAAVVCLSAAPAGAAFDLQITEMWPGNNPNDSNGDNQTGDWFEVTNVGDMDWTSADGTLYFDDSNPSVANADEMFGITTIAAGESVVFVDDDLSLPSVTIGIWNDLWSGPLGAAGQSMPQVGYYSGSGLSGGGDEVNLWLDADANLELTDIIDTKSYDDADGNPRGGRSFDAVFGIYSRDFYSVITAANDNGNPSTGTPGFIAPIPEPSCAALAALAIGSLLAGRRR